MLLLLLGGFFVLVEGYVDSGSGSYFSGLSLNPLHGIDQRLGIGALVLGCLMMVFAISLYLSPTTRRLDAAVGAVLAMTSLLTGGGFLFGAALGIAGGVLALAWRPSPPFYIAPPDLAMCPRCGAAVPPLPAHAPCPACRGPT